MNKTATETERFLREGSGPWADLALTLPIFVGYHLGVIFLPVRNAADLVTRELVNFANNSLLGYGGLTLGIGAVFISVLLVLGRGHTLRFERFLLVGIEGIIYAVAMRLVAGYVIGRLRLAAAGGGNALDGQFAGLVMSFGAGFYEELAFRVVLFGLGLKLVRTFWPGKIPLRGLLAPLLWGAITAAVFSGWHYVGDLGEPFELRSFVFRWVCGAIFSLIYAFRGFAPAVWTHTLYDAWVLMG